MNPVSRLVAFIKERKLVRFHRSHHTSKEKKEKYFSNVNGDLSYADTEGSSSRERSTKVSRTSSVEGRLCVEPSIPIKSFVRNSRGRLCLGMYEVQRTLGIGKQARVLLAKNVFTGEFVALKVVDTEHINPKYERHIKNEIHALRTINHSNILQMKEVFFDVIPTPNVMRSRSAVVLVLDYCPGGELFDIMLTTGGFSEPLARTYFRQLVSAVSACHRQGIYHRDIKPQNMLLDSNFQLKIADFGVCSLNLKERDMCETFCGTLSYMAPEVIIGQTYSGEKADSWSLGIVLFILLAGSPPLKVATPDDWWFKAIQTRRMEKFWHAHKRISPGFPDSARSILSRLLIADPDERCTVRELNSDPWLAGPIVSPSKLKSEMTKRLSIVRASRDEGELKSYREKQVKFAESDAAFEINKYRSTSALSAL